MAWETKSWFVYHLCLLIACYMQQCVNGNTSQTPCLFIFGDSLSDSGNNNYIPTTAKADYAPYGIDFPEGPTGRVTNGKTRIDIISKLLGFVKFIPPFLNTTGFDIKKGVNYASASAGIRNETGKRTAVTNIEFGRQIENHKIIVAQIAANLGSVANANQYLKKCIYYIYIGTNDYALNYFQPNLYNTSRMYNPEEYAKVLIDQLSDYGKVLYDLGARKFVAVGLGKIGCTPMILATTPTNGSSCVEKLNDIEAIFSHKLRALVNKFNTEYPDSKSIFINTTAIRIDRSFGFTNFNTSCCPMKSNGFCIRGSTPCPNRRRYIYFDGIHPTEAANNYTGSISYDSNNNPNITSPMDIKRLAEANI